MIGRMASGLTPLQRSNASQKTFIREKGKALLRAFEERMTK